MQEHEYRARDKTVKKMSRDGLKEENLHSRKSIRVSNRETDDFFCATQAEDMEDFSKRGERAEDTKSAKKKLYSEKADPGKVHFCICWVDWMCQQKGKCW